MRDHTTLGEIAEADDEQRRFLDARERAPPTRRLFNNTYADILAIAVVMILARTGGGTRSDAYRWAFASLAAIYALTMVSATFLRRAQPRE